MRLLPAFAAAILFALSGGVAEAPFEIPAVAPVFLLGFAGLCLASRELAPTAIVSLLAPLGLVTLPPGSRWMVIQALLVVLLLHIMLRLRHRLREKQVLEPAELFGLTLFLHVGFAGHVFLPWHLDLAAAAQLVMAPIVGAIALDRIIRRRGFDTGLALATTCALLGSGWTAAGLLPLVALAAADEVAHAAEHPSPQLRRAVAAIVLLAPCLVETRLGLLAAVAGLAAALPHLFWRLGAPLVLLFAAIAFQLRPPADNLPNLLVLAAVAPSALLVARRDLGLATAAAALGFAGLLAGPAPADGAVLVTLAPAALVALSAPRLPGGKKLQTAWSLALVSAAILVASFPWLARSPIEKVGSVARAALESVFDLARGRPGWQSLSASRGDLSGERLQLSLPIGVRRVAVVSQMANSAQLPFATAVARVRLTGTDGGRTTYPVRSGIETGEWAARRPELQGLPGSRAPELWRAFVAPPTSARGAEIGQVYRAEFIVSPGSGSTTLEILDSSDLPSGALFEVRGIEWR